MLIEVFPADIVERPDGLAVGKDVLRHRQASHHRQLLKDHA